jgi:hypothetical protein
VARTSLTPTSLGGGDLADPAGTTIDSTLVTNGVVVNTADPSRTGGTDGPAWMGVQGDYDTSVATTATRWIGPFSEARYLQHGGKLNIDFESGFTGTITAFKLTRGI